MQAANTGLTEGSTPHGDDYDRPLVIVSTLRLDKLQLLDEGQPLLHLREILFASFKVGEAEPELVKLRAHLLRQYLRARLEAPQNG